MEKITQLLSSAMTFFILASKVAVFHLKSIYWGFRLINMYIFLKDFKAQSFLLFMIKKFTNGLKKHLKTRM